jgi:hypothetical protein
MSAITEFRKPHGSRGFTRVSRFPLPLDAGLRIAQFSSGNVLFGDARPISSTDYATLQTFDPQLIIGSSLDLETLARKVGEGSVTLRSLTHALYVITTCYDMPLRDSARVLLWQTFGVPIFEVLLAGDGLPIAAECDAHEGWHVVDGVTFWYESEDLWFRRKRSLGQSTGLTATIENSRCGCGQTGQRLLDVRMDFRDPLRHQLPQSA